MADDAERAAKAARAKAMLKKRQQQKAGAGTHSPSRAASPAPGSAASPVSGPRSPEPEHQDAAVLFADAPKGEIDFGEFGVLSQGKGARSPPPISSPPAPQAQALAPTAGRTPASPTQNGGAASDELRSLITNQQQTISLLVNEKASLAAQLDRLEDLEAKSTESEKLLGEERYRANGLANRLRLLEEQSRATTETLSEVSHRERIATEKCREQDRELELARRNAGELKSQLDSRERDLRELREQIEADDRAETLERTLKGTQDRAEELEFQLSKFKQNHATTSHEREALEQRLTELTSIEAEWKQRLASLEQESGSAHSEVSALSSSLDAAERARADLEGQLATSEASLVDVQQRVSQLAAELASHARQLQGTQADVASAQRRAEAAEDAQRSLQAENSGLLAQLEEVRPKVVELSNKGAEDEERIWEAERRGRALEAAVTRLEVEVGKHRAAEDELREKSEDLEKEMQRNTERHDDDLKEVQDAYAKVTGELKQAEDHVAQLQHENSEQRASIQARVRDVNHWKAQVEAREADLEAVKDELGDGRKVEDDTLAIVRDTQAEIEGLRDQLALREDELARLRDASSNSGATSPVDGKRPNLEKEMLSAARQQHALDLSTAHSRIRELETQVFDAQAKVHSFQRRVTALEDELTRVRALPDARSPPPFPRGQSFQTGSDDSRRHSLSSTRPHTPASLRPLIAPRVVYDANLSAETRHKRKVSLSMLKARIESERAAAQHASSVSLASSPRPPLRVLSSTTIAEADELTETTAGAQTPRTASESRTSHSHKRLSGRGMNRPPQFLDETHVFWCHSCHGDLVVL